MNSGLYKIEKLVDTNSEGWTIHMKSVLVH